MQVSSEALTVSLVQTETHWHDAEANRLMFDHWFEQVPETANVIVLPEMFTTGFTMSSSTMAETMSGTTVQWLMRVAAERSVAICGSVVIRDGESYYNRFLWAAPDGSLSWYDKRHRFRMAGEHEHYAAGDARVTIALGAWRVCPQVCYDLRFPVWTRNRDDYDVLITVANWPAARHDAWNTLLKARAIENQCFVVGVNVVGVDGAGVRYAGGSVVYDPEGAALVRGGGQAGVFTAVLDKPHLEAYRKNFPAWRDADQFDLEKRSPKT